MQHPLPLLPHHFPQLPPIAQQQCGRFLELLRHWNGKINLISRKDIDHLYLHHLVHSLAITRWITFEPGMHVLDAGTGGGFPGIPLAICYPETQFCLVDSIGKKVRVVENMVHALGLGNVRVLQSRVEHLVGDYDFVVSRAFGDPLHLWEMVHHLIRRGNTGKTCHGLLYLTGDRPILDCSPPLQCERYQLASQFPEEAFFVGKILLHFFREGEGVST